MPVVYRLSTQQKPGLLARILLGIAAVGLVIVGFFFFTIALIAGALLALVIGVRLWWMLRKLKRAAAEAGGIDPGGAGNGRSGHSAPLDGEYQVVERETSGEKLPRSSGSSNTPPAP